MNWKDSKYLLAYLTPLSGYIALTTNGIGTFSAVIFTFLIIPILEQVAPQYTTNLSSEQESHKEKQIIFDILLYLNIPILFFLLWLYLQRIYNVPSSLFEYIGLTLSMGVMIGVLGINVGHEIGHRPSKIHQWISRFLLLPGLYMHFNIEHNRGHHKWVATPLDPATSRKGESFYSFIFRSVKDSYKDAWRIQMKDLKIANLPFFHYKNMMLLFQIIQIVFLIIIAIVFNFNTMIFAIIAAIIGFSLLEAVNYIEHYGLIRNKMENGHYEPIQAHHSWNSNHEIGRILLYELTRHSNHHFKSTRKYQVLRHFDESPQLPLGYPASILLALVPSLWFRKMDELLEELHLKEAY